MVDNVYGMDQYVNQNYVQMQIKLQLIQMNYVKNI